MATTTSASFGAMSTQLFAASNDSTRCTVTSSTLDNTFSRSPTFDASVTLDPLAVNLSTPHYCQWWNVKTLGITYPVPRIALVSTLRIVLHERRRQVQPKQMIQVVVLWHQEYLSSKWSWPNRRPWRCNGCIRWCGRRIEMRNLRNRDVF